MSERCREETGAGGVQWKSSLHCKAEIQTQDIQINMSAWARSLSASWRESTKSFPWGSRSASPIREAGGAGALISYTDDHVRLMLPGHTYASAPGDMVSSGYQRLHHTALVEIKKRLREGVLCSARDIPRNGKQCPVRRPDHEQTR
jgi:hypothetical protein